MKFNRGFRRSLIFLPYSESMKKLLPLAIAGILGATFTFAQSTSTSTPAKSAPAKASSTAKTKKHHHKTATKSTPATDAAKSK